MGVGYGVGDSVGGWIVGGMRKGVYLVGGMLVDVEGRSLMVEKGWKCRCEGIGLKVRERMVSEGEDESVLCNGEGSGKCKGGGGDGVGVEVVLCG